MESTLFAEIESELNLHHHSFQEVVGVLISDGSHLVSVPIDNFEYWAKKRKLNDDFGSWISNIPYPLILIGKSDWWVESVEYDSRVTLAFCERYRPRPATHIIVGSQSDTTREHFQVAEINTILHVLKDTKKEGAK